MKKLLPICAALLFAGCSDDGWQDLFNGENLDGWHAYGIEEGYNGWYVDQGVIAFDPGQRTVARNSNLVTDKEYTSFELSMEWLISEHGNSGLFWAVQGNEELEFNDNRGAEIQILDDGYTEYIEQRGDINRAGSLYNLMAPSSIVSKPANEWNHYFLHVDHANNVGFLRFNDVEVLRFPVNGPEWQELIADKGHGGPDFGKARTGRIALQDWGGRVAFRNMKIRELNQ